MVIPITIEGQHIYRRIIFSQSVRIDEPLIYCETPVKLQPFLAAKRWNPPDFCRTVIKKISKCKKMRSLSVCCLWSRWNFEPVKACLDPIYMFETLHIHPNHVWLVVEPPLWKMMEFVWSVGIMKFPIYRQIIHSCSKAPTRFWILFWWVPSFTSPSAFGLGGDMETMAGHKYRNPPVKPASTILTACFEEVSFYCPIWWEW